MNRSGDGYIRFDEKKSGVLDMFILFAVWKHLGDYGQRAS